MDIKRDKMNYSNLLFIKKNNKKPKEGDVFVINPQKDLYCFGKVIKTNVESKDSFVNGMYLVYIYNHFSDHKDMPDNLDPENLMFAPIVINANLWKKGYAEIIGNNGVDEKDSNVNFGFWSIVEKKYVNLHGDIIDYKPRYVGTYGLGSYGVIGKEIQKVIKEKNL